MNYYADTDQGGRIRAAFLAGQDKYGWSTMTDMQLHGVMTLVETLESEFNGGEHFEPMPPGSEHDEDARPPSRRWLIWAVSVYLLGGLAPAVTGSVMLELGTKPTELEAVTTVFVLAGLVFGGLGQLMRAAAHGGAKWIDGAGKITGLFGWAVALFGAVVFAAKDIEGLDVNFVVLLYGLTVVLPTVITLVLPLCVREVTQRWKKWKERPARNPRPARGAALVMVRRSSKDRSGGSAE